MTFSIVGYDPNTGDLGVAVQSKFLCVGAIVPWARANVGAVATQGGADHGYGLKGLTLLESGLSPDQVIVKLVRQGQVGVIDRKGNVAAFTGKECPPWAGHFVGEYYSCQGNVLVSEETIQSMASAFEKEPGDLSEKLIAALVAAINFSERSPCYLIRTVKGLEISKRILKCVFESKQFVYMQLMNVILSYKRHYQNAPLSVFQSLHYSLEGVNNIYINECVNIPYETKNACITDVCRFSNWSVRTDCSIANNGNSHNTNRIKTR